MANLDEIRQQLSLLNDGELIAILRERDEEQWRPEVFIVAAAILNERGVSPDAISKSDENLQEETAGLNLAIVGSYFNAIDAESDRLTLASKGVRSWVFDSQITLPAGVLLKVCEEDYVAAMAILESGQSEPALSSDLPADIAEPPCPHCGARKVMEEADMTAAFPANEPADSSSRQAWLYHCASCGYKWSASSE